MLTLIVVVTATILLMIGVPIAFAFGIGAVLLIAALGVDFMFVMPISYELLSSFLFLALPLYILAGSLMGVSGIADRLVKLFVTLFGHFRGGLGAAVIVTNAIFGAISGAASSAVGALGLIFIPRLQDHGYSRGYAVTLVAVTAVLSLLIPPSLSMIIFGVLTHLPITVLFLTTVGPGLILMMLFIVVNYVLTRSMPEVHVEPKLPVKEYVKSNVISFKNALWGLFMPLIILGGIYGGFFTPTEAACVAVLYCIPVGFFVYKSFTIKNVVRGFIDTGTITASIIIVFFFLFIFSRIFIVEDIPEQMINMLTSFTTNPGTIYFILTMFLVFLGMIMDDTSALVIAAIILYPVAVNFGMDPRQFAALAGVGTGMGLITPPVAPTLYMASRIGGGVPLNEYIKPTMVYVIFAYLPVLILTAYFPELSLYIPRLILGID